MDKSLTFGVDHSKLIQVINPTSLGAEADGSPVPSEDATRICLYCDFAIHVGRGPVTKELCQICLSDLFSGEVTLG